MASNGFYIKNMVNMNLKSESDENGLCDDIYENMDITIESLEAEGFCSDWAALESLGQISTYAFDDGLPHVDSDKTYQLPFLDGISTTVSPIKDLPSTFQLPTPISSDKNYQLPFLDGISTTVSPIKDLPSTFQLPTPISSDQTYQLPFLDGISTTESPMKDSPSLFQLPSPISVLDQELATSGETRAKRIRTKTKRCPRNWAHNPLPAMPLPICSTPKKTKEKKKRKKLVNLSNVLDTMEERHLQPNKRCTHCEITTTPQWRVGPMGPKTLCNACGVRYRSGRLFPEYRPAASPTFVPMLHSNSHRKVVEMRNKSTIRAMAMAKADDMDGSATSAPLEYGSATSTPLEYGRATSAPLEFVPMSCNFI